jgi:Cytochrome C oxidase, cbb3-type, subunit III
VSRLMARLRKPFWPSGLGAILCAGLLLGIVLPRQSQATGLFPLFGSHKACDCQTFTEGDGNLGGTWYWLRSPEEEKRVVASLYNRYCIRCHGVDGRGVWDIPGVPDFTNVRWQESRSDAERARIIVEGRGAVMPPFRGVLSLEEAWAIGRYLHSFVPGTEVSRPDFGPAKSSGGSSVPVQPKAGPTTK